ncbi:hypothetical protein [Chitinophaga sp. HK235]|uniref:hypothetical protein n=1 Tax=Chitinophaga sp. HK235 TaxID=2952571 RepID=UPI001BAC9117|nr:hypothetical protein [Chitinophaga sp. HK235]
MKILLLTIVCVPCMLVTSAQSLWMPLGKDIGSGSYSRHFQDVASAAYQPAGLSCLRTFSAGLYAEQRFRLQELPLYMAMAAFPVGAGAFGLQLSRIGSSAYYRQSAALAYGRSLGRRVGLGIGFNYETEVLPGYGSRGYPSVTGGMLYHPGICWHIGLRIYYSPQQPAVYSAGIGWEAAASFLLTAEVVKAADEAAWMRATASYRIAPPLALQWGIATRAPFHYAGVNIYWHALRIMFAAGFHPQLGITPSTTIIWQRDSTE